MFYMLYGFCFNDVEHGKIVDVPRCRVRSSRLFEIPTLQGRGVRLAISVTEKPIDEYIFQNEAVGKRARVEETEVREKVKQLIIYCLPGHFEKNELNLCRQEEESDVTFR